MKLSQYLPIELILECFLRVYVFSFPGLTQSESALKSSNKVDNSGKITMQFVSEVLWSEKFWLPQRVTWKDFVSNDPSVHYPDVSEIFFQSILAGFALLAFRYANER